MASLAAPLAIAGLGGLAGLLGNKPQKTTTTSQNAGATAFQNSGYQYPVYDPATQELRDALTSQFKNLSSPDMAGYAAQGINNINQNSDIRTNALKNSLAARGLSYSPIASIAPAMSQNQRIGDISQFQNSLPLIQQQLMLQNLNAGAGYLKGLPIGSANTASGAGQSSEQGTSTQIGTGNQAAGGIAGLATTLAGLYGKGAFGGK